MHGVFESIRLFAKMQDKLAKRVRACFHTVQVKEGDIILAKGDRCDAFYVVHEGDIGIFAQRSEGDRTADADGNDAAQANTSDMLTQSLDLFTMDESPDGSRASSASPTPRAAQTTRDSNANRQPQHSLGNAPAGQLRLAEKALEAEIIGGHSVFRIVLPR